MGPKHTPTSKKDITLRQQTQKQKENVIIIEEQRQEIENLKKQVQYLDKTVYGIRHDMNLIHSKLEVSSHVNNVLRTQLDDLQQYSRRYSILLDNVPAKSNESTEEIENEVKNILVNNFKCNENNLVTQFDKAHRIGGKHEDNS